MTSKEQAQAKVLEQSAEKLGRAVERLDNITKVLEDFVRDFKNREHRGQEHARHAGSA